MKTIALFALALIASSCFRTTECECYTLESDTYTIVESESSCSYIKSGMHDDHPDGYTYCTQIVK